MKDISLGQYYPVESPVHRLDPRSKILGVILLIVSVFVAKTFAGLALCALFILTVTLIARIPLGRMLSGLKAIYILLIFTFLLNVFFYGQGTELFHIWKLTVTVGGILRALFMALRLMLLVVGAGLLTYTTSPIALTDGLESLLSPLKIVHFPVHEIAMMMSIALRFIPILTEETDKIIKAQTARGASFDHGGLFRRARAMVALLIPLLVSAFRRADELAMAMEARCYHGGEGRTRLKVLRFAGRDAVALTVCALFCAVLILDRIFGAGLFPYLVG